VVSISNLAASWLELRMPKTVLTSKGNLFPLKQSVLLTYETIISYAYPHHIILLLKSIIDKRQWKVIIVFISVYYSQPNTVISTFLVDTQNLSNVFHEDTKGLSYIPNLALGVLDK
jgi:hypothetical protein